MTKSDYVAETESVFTGTTVICLLCGLLVGSLLDGGVISYPARQFYFPMALYLFVRFVVWKIRKRVPKLEKNQIIGIYWMPVYGFLMMFAISSAIRVIRHGL